MKLDTSKTISFLGCGWLGLPSALKLLHQGYKVKVSTTTESKIDTFKEKGLKPFLINLSAFDEKSLIDFLNTDTLIINIPPGKSSETNFHASQLNKIIPFLEQSTISHIIYVSATSVYHEQNQIAFESDVLDATQASNQKLGLAENLIKAIKNKHITILRYGGLVGGSRNLLKFFEGKINVNGGNVPVNLIHQNDAVNLLCDSVIEQLWDETYNVCCPIHPTKKEFYTNLANQFKAVAPQFIENDDSNYKIINSDKIIKKLDYKFEYENPLDFEY